MILIQVCVKVLAFHHLVLGCVQHSLGIVTSLAFLGCIGSYEGELECNAMIELVQARQQYWDPLMESLALGSRRQYPLLRPGQESLNQPYLSLVASMVGLGENGSTLLDPVLLNFVFCLFAESCPLVSSVGCSGISPSLLRLPEVLGAALGLIARDSPLKEEASEGEALSGLVGVCGPITSGTLGDLGLADEARGSIGVASVMVIVVLTNATHDV